MLMTSRDVLNIVFLCVIFLRCTDSAEPFYLEYFTRALVLSASALIAAVASAVAALMAPPRSRPLLPPRDDEFVAAKQRAAFPGALLGAAGNLCATGMNDSMFLLAVPTFTLSLQQWSGGMKDLGEL